MPEQNKTYDLEERTTRFSESVIKLCKGIRSDVVMTPLVSQLVRSGTSIGANYAEANGASSKKDFQNKIFICKKEAQETRYWLRLIKLYIESGDIDALLQEAQELVFIFQKITATLKSKS